MFHTGDKMKLRAFCSLLIILILCVLTASCCSPILFSTQSWANDEIDSAIREQIHELNDDVVQSLKSDNSTALLDMMVDELKETQASKDQIRSFVHDTSEQIAGSEFDIHAEYYWKRKGTGGGMCTIEPATAGDFRIEIEGASDEMFFSLLKGNDGFRKPIIGIAYVKSGDSWEIYSLRIGVVEIGEKTAPEWYEEAKDLYSKGYLVSAMLRQQMASACLQPVLFCHYEQESEIKGFTEELQSEIDRSYTFPLELSDLAGKPKIYNIEPQFLQSEILPKIIYMTTLSLDDEQALEDEAKAMKPAIEELFPGITVGVNHLVFSAFSEPPLDPSKTYQSYGTVVDV